MRVLYSISFEYLKNLDIISLVGTGRKSGELFLPAFNMLLLLLVVKA